MRPCGLPCLSEGRHCFGTEGEGGGGAPGTGSFLGNPGLCKDLTKLCPSPRGGTESHRGFVWLLRVVFILAALIFVAVVAWFYRRFWDYRRAKLGMDLSKWALTSFHKLGFREYEILDCLDEDNVIGSGASGKVYKAVLSNGEAVAVKKLSGTPKKENDVMDQSSDNGFEEEVATLGKIRHKNIVKLWCSVPSCPCPAPFPPALFRLGTGAPPGGEGRAHPPSRNRNVSPLYRNKGAPHPPSVPEQGRPLER